MNLSLILQPQFEILNTVLFLIEAHHASAGISPCEIVLISGVLNKILLW